MSTIEGEIKAFEEHQKFIAETNALLEKYSDRNYAFLVKTNHVETYSWAREFENNNVGGSRDEMGDEKFNAMLSTMGSYNGLLLTQFSKHEMNEEKAILYLDTLAKNKNILTDKK